MSKRLLVVSLLFLVVGCSQDDPEKSTTVCTFNDADSGITIDQKIKLTAGDDELYTIEDSESFTFESVERYQSDIDKRVENYKEKKKCPEKVGDKCSDSVTFDWELKENVLSSTTTIDITKAIENEEKISVFDEMPKDDEYISLKQTIKSLKDQGYTCEDTKKEKAK